MQKLGAAILLVGLFACAGTPKAPEPVPPPVVAPKPPTEPFGALLELRKNPASLDLYASDRVSRQQFKDHLLHGYSAADRLDGVLDGSAPIAESCKELSGMCKSADANADGKLSLREFLDELDELFAEADMNHDRALSRKETARMWEPGP